MIFKCETQLELEGGMENMKPNDSPKIIEYDKRVISSAEKEIGT